MRPPQIFEKLADASVMKTTPKCPVESCHSHTMTGVRTYSKNGYFVTRHNHQPVPRYRCRVCGKNFSAHTGKPTYRQKKPALNSVIYGLYSSGMTLRRMAVVLKVDKKTVTRKFIFLAVAARAHHEAQLAEGALRTTYVQFDELETYEHTKLKPLSVALAVRVKTGQIIAACVASMPANGHTAARSRELYGSRPDHRQEARRAVMEAVRLCQGNRLTVASDAHRSYPNIISAAVPDADIRVYARVDALAQNRRTRPRDPLFAVNHACAMLRADVSRLARRTWVTSKRAEGLQRHLDLYLAWNNGYKL